MNPRQSGCSVCSNLSPSTASNTQLSHPLPSGRRGLLLQGDMSQSSKKPRGQKHGCCGESTGRGGLRGVEREPALPASGCQGLTVRATATARTPRRRELCRRHGAAVSAFVCRGKNKRPINLSILHCFATQKLLLSTRAKSCFLSHHFLSGVLTLSCPP